MPKHVQHSWSRYGGRKGKDSMCPRVYVNKDAPDYVPEYYRTPMTQRQKDIIDGRIPLDSIRKQELKVIMKKAEYQEDEDTHYEACRLYALKDNEDVYVPTFSKEEAEEMLRRLTPWETD